MAAILTDVPLLDHGSWIMSSRAKVQERVRPAKTEIDIGDKLNVLADAIHEFADFVELVEHKIKHIETRLRRIEM